MHDCTMRELLLYVVCKIVHSDATIMFCKIVDIKATNEKYIDSRGGMLLQNFQLFIIMGVRNRAHYARNFRRDFWTTRTKSFQLKAPHSSDCIPMPRSDISQTAVKASSKQSSTFQVS